MVGREIQSRYILEEKYRPVTYHDIILPIRYTPIVEGMIKDGIIPHLLLSGTRGCGKTSLAYVLANETNASLLYINASLDRTTDVMKNKVEKFCSKVAVGNKKYKIILLDEIDNPYAKDFRKSLLSPIEKYGENTRFILTCNQKYVLDRALISRCSEIDFVFIKNQDTKICKMKFINRLEMILSNEKIEYDTRAIAYLVERKFPDMRKVINIINLLSKGGKIDQERIDIALYADIDRFFNIIKSKDFEALKQYTQSLNMSPEDFYSMVYSNIESSVVSEDIPSALIKTYSYLKDLNLIADSFISINTFGLDLMSSVRLK